MTTKPRQTKTPRQRAQEQLDVATRVADRLGKQMKQLSTSLEAVQAEHRAAIARRDHLKKHPDLATNPGGTVSTSTPGGSTR